MSSRIAPPQVFVFFPHRENHTHSFLDHNRNFVFHVDIMPRPLNPDNNRMTCRPFLLGSLDFGTTTHTAHCVFREPGSVEDMPTQQELLRRDVDLLGQQYRVVLVGFTPLDSEHDRLQQANQLREFAAAALPLVQTTLRDTLGEAWCQPRMNTASSTVVRSMTPALSAPLGEAAEGLLQHIIGEAPPALQLAQHFTPQAVVGIFRQRGSDYLVRLRSGYSGSIVSHILTQIAGPMLRAQEGTQLRIFLDRNIRGVTKGKGKGKGKAKGRGKGKGKAPERDRSPRRAAPAPPPAAPAGAP